MSVQNHGPDYWSDIVQTEIRLPQMFDSRDCLLPSESVGLGPRFIALARRVVKVFCQRLGVMFAHRAPSSSATSCADACDAYMHACLAAPFFCYVSPELYGLTTRNENRVATHVDAEPADDL